QTATNVPSTTHLRITFNQLIADGASTETLSTGELTFPTALADSDEFTGHWQLEPADLPASHVPQDESLRAMLSGEGTFKCTRDAKSRRIELYPDLVDNNFEITVLHNIIGIGEWRYITFAGITATGPAHIEPLP
ncbi:MAG TPA: hypothetical protein VG711_08880, partial [Phycisphaerales bacterium]|nr:hypothetical protein [Phycisphaerales bacterium]